MGLARQHPQRTARCAVEAQAVQRDHLIGSGTAHAVEHPQHGVLAKCGGHDGQPQIHHPPHHLQAEAAVLRQPPLADVELGHHLQPRDHPLSQRHAVDASDAGHHAINTKADVGTLAMALNVDVAHIVQQRIVQHGVQQRDNRA